MSRSLLENSSMTNKRLKNMRNLGIKADRGWSRRAVAYSSRLVFRNHGCCSLITPLFFDDVLKSLVVKLVAR